MSYNHFTISYDFLKGDQAFLFYEKQTTAKQLLFIIINHFNCLLEYFICHFILSSKKHA